MLERKKPVDMIFIPHNVPSLKNSKVKTSKGIFASPTVSKYIRKLIEDDNVKYVFPVPMSIDGRLINESNPREFPLYSVDKDNAGVWIKIF